MKKILALILAVTALFSFASCGEENNNVNEGDDTQIRVAYMAGPTGIGMAKLINDYGGIDAGGQYTFTQFTDATKVPAALKSGQVDVACMPTNQAATVYNNAGSDIMVLAINCLNSLSFLTKDGVTVDSISDLEGKTIYTCKNGTPKIFLEKLLEAYEINATVSTTYTKNGEEQTIVEPAHILAFAKSEKPDVVLAPEPIISNFLFQTQDSYNISLNITELWNAKYDVPIAMGCIVAKKSFVQEHPEVVNSFLEEYKASINYMADANNIDNAAQYAVDTKIIGNIVPAKTALNNLRQSLKYEDGAEMKRILEGNYTLIEITHPENGFYYEKSEN